MDTDFEKMCGGREAIAEQTVRQGSCPPERLREDRSRPDRDPVVARGERESAAASSQSSFSPPPRPLRNDRTGFFFAWVALLASRERAAHPNRCRVVGGYDRVQAGAYPAPTTAFLSPRPRSGWNQSTRCLRGAGYERVQAGDCAARHCGAARHCAAAHPNRCRVVGGYDRVQAGASPAPNAAFLSPRARSGWNHGTW